MGTDPASKLLVYLIIYVSSFGFLLLVSAFAGKYAGNFHKKRATGRGSQIDAYAHGVFASALWPVWLRGPISMIITLTGLMPCAIMCVCFVLGALLAWLEQWSYTDGTLYLLGNLLGLLTPLTDNSPDTEWGRIVGVIISCWALLLMQTIIGIVAGLSLVDHWAQNVPPSAFGFLRYLVLYIPIALIGSAGALGALMAAVEDWSVSDGLFFVVGSVCQLAHPLVDNVPESSGGMFLEVLAVCLELGFSAGIIGVVVAHPVSRKILVLIEGVDAEKEFVDRVNDLKSLEDKHSLTEAAATQAICLTKFLRAHGLLPAQPSVEELKGLFTQLDKAGSGQLNVDEVKQSLPMLGVEPKNYEHIFGMHADGKPTMNRDELLKLFEQAMASHNNGLEEMSSHDKKLQEI